MKRYLLLFSLLFSLCYSQNQKKETPNKFVGFQLNLLEYNYDELEPYFDKQTMEIHHTKHHQTYINNLNKLIVNTDLEKKSLEEIVKLANKNSDALRNNVGGVYNHNLFFDIISPKGLREPQGELLNIINKKYGSYEKFKEEFKKMAMSIFGSGWAWLILENKDLKIVLTANQDNPLMVNTENNIKLLIGIDVWEHSYYLKYQNRRADYIDSFFKVLDWNKVTNNFNK